jgi:hypothetical protein
MFSALKNAEAGRQPGSRRCPGNEASTRIPSVAKSGAAWTAPSVALSSGIWSR